MAVFRQQPLPHLDVAVFDLGQLAIDIGAISVRNGMFPETKTTEPYSPTDRANARAKPVMSAG